MIIKGNQLLEYHCKNEKHQIKKKSKRFFLCKETRTKHVLKGLKISFYTRIVLLTVLNMARVEDSCTFSPEIFFFLSVLLGERVLNSLSVNGSRNFYVFQEYCCFVYVIILRFIYHMTRFLPLFFNCFLFDYIFTLYFL